MPLQTERDTLGRGQSGYNFEEILKNISENGYFPDEIVEVINVDKINYIIDGHHRNFATAYMGKTLIPYIIIAKDEDNIDRYGNTARDRANSIELQNLIGHEWMIQNSNEKFSYKKVFPEIYSKLENKRDKDR